MYIHYSTPNTTDSLYHGHTPFESFLNIIIITSTFAFRLTMLLFSQIALLASLALASPGHHNHKSGRPARCDFEARNLETISSIYNLTTFPNNLAVVVGGEDAVPDGLFNDDVVGRVDPVGQFDGITDSIEYFFTLASPNKDGGVGITSFEITSYTSGCPGVAASTVFLYTSIIDADGKDTGVESLPIKQVRTTHTPHNLAHTSSLPFGSSTTTAPFWDTTHTSHTSTAGSWKQMASTWRMPRSWPES